MPPSTAGEREGIVLAFTACWNRRRDPVRCAASVLFLAESFECRVETKFPLHRFKSASLKLCYHKDLVGHRKLADLEAVGSGLNKAKPRVIVLVAEQEDERITVCAASFLAFCDKLSADAPPLVFGKNRKRSEGGHLMHRPPVIQGGRTEHNMADHDAVIFSNDG